jgi:hypothetical protein
MQEQEEQYTKEKVKERYGKIGLTINSDCCCVPGGAVMIIMLVVILLP